VPPLRLNTSYCCFYLFFYMSSLSILYFIHENNKYACIFLSTSIIYHILIKIVKDFCLFVVQSLRKLALDISLYSIHLTTSSGKSGFSLSLSGSVPFSILFIEAAFDVDVVVDTVPILLFGSVLLL
jgi:hypothetical protein